MDSEQIIIILAVVNALLALHLVNKKKKESFRMRVINGAAAASNRAFAIDPSFGLQLAAMQTVPGVVGITGNGASIDYDKAAQAIIENRGTFGDLVGQLQRNYEAPYIKNLNV